MLLRKIIADLREGGTFPTHGHPPVVTALDATYAENFIQSDHGPRKHFKSGGGGHRQKRALATMTVCPWPPSFAMLYLCMYFVN